ncbi:hypothetical protein BDP55DRAFT_633918 [Colletotrichum godetiae]|uniref:Uncharacterized protein n=1 Tax=Colletotrichum godetiae TaxID=1209918 RepID=A0AAJ0EVW5_9PEZI|nr:uncharacterized protein BDP55DRAFT_633918 [Colletotrichum godetiae]KAK1673645.1 hypothetical protein BDP55DRAFT_633918 [Colletotrichum godetiae]
MSKPGSPKSRQLSRLDSDPRRCKDEKIMREIASDESTLPAGFSPVDNSAGQNDGISVQDEASEEEKSSAQQDADPPGMSRRALEVTKKRKLVFEIDDGPPRKRR